MREKVPVKPCKAILHLMCSSETEIVRKLRKEGEHFPFDLHREFHLLWTEQTHSYWTESNYLELLGSK